MNLTRLVITDKKVVYGGQTYDAYGPALTAVLASSSPDDAAHNADNYRWFATAMYLDSYDWSRILAGKGPAANAKRANVTGLDLVGMDSLKRRSFFERRQVDWRVEDEADEEDWKQFSSLSRY